MTRISKKILTLILSAIAFLSLMFGFIITIPQMKTAKAESVTFNAAALGDAQHEVYGTSIRFDTAGQTWASYHNWENAANWASIADYTTVNGRTVTEINNATTHTQKITLMMQPAGSFSFLRLYIPAEIMPLSDVKSMGIMDGWSFNDGTATYTTSAVTFLRSGDAMVLKDNYSTESKLTASNISISDAKLENPSNSAWGTDSYTVKIDIGQKIAGEFETMYGGYKSIRNAIYINGKSIEEWNTQKIAEDPKFKDPSSYAFFPQNSTDPSHLDPFVKPVGLWATETGFRLTIYQELLADCKTVTVTVGAGCTQAGKFMVAESVSKTVLTQSVVNVTEKLTFLDNSHNSPEAWGPTNMYYIHMNNEALWTKAPLGGCLNEYDPIGAGGGQIQMKYIYFNGTSVYDINKNDNGSYNSTQDNIKNGSIYAPILVTMSAEPGVGSSLKLTVPTNFTNSKAGHEEIIIKKGFSVVENGVSYYVSNDIVFTNNGTTAWTKEVKAIEKATEVTGIITKANRTDGGNNENFVIFQLSNNDYAGCKTTAITDISSLFGYIDINGNTLNAAPGEPYFNVWGIENSVAFRFADAAILQNVAYITIKAGAKFPSYNTQYNDQPLTYYVTREDVTFIHDVPNDTWTVGTLSKDVTVTYMVEGTEYKTQTVTRGTATTAPAAPTKAADENYVYTFAGWQLDGNPYDFSAPVMKDIILEAAFTQSEKASTIDITNETSFGYQGEIYTGTGTATYIVRTQKNYWTKAPQGGCLNEHDPDNAGGGQEQMKYLYLNGTSLYDINKNDNGSYGSTQDNIAGGGIYAPILVTMGSDNGVYSYIQIHIPMGYPNEGADRNENHKSFEIKAGFSVTENNVTYTITKDLKWINLSGTWTSAKHLIEAENVTIGTPRQEGVANELYKVDVTFPTEYKFTCNNYDFMYAGAYAEYRKQIFINGVSIYDINENTNDSAYVYSTFPMTGADDATFAKPIIIETYTKNGESPTNVMTIWIHETYINTLGEDIMVTVGAGFKYTWSKSLAEDVSYDMMATVTINDGSKTYTTKYIKGSKLNIIPNKPNTDTTIYDFTGWYVAGTGELFDSNEPISKDISVEARFDVTNVTLIETTVLSVEHQLKTSEDNWIAFELSEKDYEKAEENYSMEGYSELIRIGFLNNIILKGSIQLNSKTVSEATLMDVYNTYGALQGPLLNIWKQGKLGIRVPVGSGVTEIVIKSGTFFPSYAHVSSGGTSDDIRYVVEKETVFKWSDTKSLFLPETVAEFDIQMAVGASVRIEAEGDASKSGIRFQTFVNVEQYEAMIASGEYADISFGTLIVPTDYLMGGQFTHEWLEKNHGDAGLGFLDIPSSGWYKDAKETKVGYHTYYGTIVDLKGKNYTRSFSGIGYAKLIDVNGNVEYVYAPYTASYSRSAAFIASAAIGDRSTTKTGEYQYKINENNNYSRYTQAQNNFLKKYLTIDKDGNTIDAPVSAIKTSIALPNLKNARGVETITLDNKELYGAYVELTYSTNVNVWGQFNYTDGNKTATEDFYLPAGSSTHKQYLDIFRYNGVGYGMDTANITMTSIKFTNAEFANTVEGNVRIVGFYSTAKTIDTDNQEIYVTVDQDDGSQMTVGAHLGIGGALTYLAKSGIYEGVIGGENAWDAGTVALRTNTNEFGAKNKYRTGNTSYATEAGYYGHATSSLPGDGAVNLINNFDAGRQIQQSWYAQVGGSDEVADESNGYKRAYCYTGSVDGQYWPYNPVQAGDVVSNPAQIVDYEVNTDKKYIYVKARAMDWAKGQDKNNKLEGTVEGGSTTKSYVENYYRLNADGTLVVNNGFVDWNGFTNMESADWASTELPAVYPVHTLNYYVSNVNGDGSWEDALEYKNDMKAWTGGTAYHQFADAKNGATKVEDWFAWANDVNGTFALGVYIPNVERFTSGRSNNSTNYYTDANFQNANAKPVAEYGKQNFFLKEDKVTPHAERGNILSDKGMMSNMQPIQYTYQSAYVSNTSYTAPGINFRMEAYKPIEYSYVICLGQVDYIREAFKEIKDKGTVTNAGREGYYEKVGLDAWARADKKWTW